MKELCKILAVCALASPLAVAAQQAEGPAAGHSDHAEREQQAVEADGGGHSMAAMQEHMRQMHEQMARIQGADDPAERQRLMHEHMQSMQQQMRMMGGMHAAQQGPSASRCAEGDAPCRMEEMRTENGMMRQRMQMMEDRLEAMQELMRQMMDHIEEAQRP
jgi:lauroyl/myristoyl acyltransferase